MFIRIRHRRLKGGHPDMRAYRRAMGTLSTQSASYDIVRAVRIDGKPRHQFVCGMGSIRPDVSERDLARFWIGALRNLRRAGFNEEQRRKAVAMTHQKGVPLPPREACLADPVYGPV